MFSRLVAREDETTDTQIFSIDIPAYRFALKDPKKDYTWTPLLESTPRICFMLNAVDSLEALVALFYTDFARMLPIRTNNLQGSKK